MLGEKHIVIIGGGVAGCAAALALKNINADIRITVIEKKTETKPRVGETLTPHIVVLLEKLGLWQSFLQCKFSPSFGTCAAWGNSNPYANESISSPYGNGWHIDRTQFDNWLIRCAQKQGIIFLNRYELVNQLFTDKKFESQQSISSQKKWKLTLQELSNIEKSTAAEENIELEADFIIDASGRQALFARSQGAQRIANDNLIGIYQFYDIAPQHSAQFESGTLVESDANGWWYSAKLPNNTLVVARMTDADINKKFHYQYISNWNTHIQSAQHTYARLEKTTALTQGQAVANQATAQNAHIIAAHSQQLSLCAGEGWLATGDAASTYDPLSSLGIFKAFRTAIFASYAIVDYVNGSDIKLSKYQAIIRKDYQHYSTQRADYYAQEKRFTSTFWQRRHQEI